MKKIELLAPAGDFERLVTAIHFGADAVYFAGKKFGLRAFASNFDEEEIIKAIKYAHERNVKVYITVNILAHNEDFVGLIDYLKFLDKEGADGVIVSDIGIASLVKDNTNLELHVSTNANITNIHSAKMWVKLGAKRLVLARELSLQEIKDIKNEVGENIDLECFGHGAMCISYSGRCLLSNYLTGRDSNKGECAQPCRWQYALGVKNDIEETNYFPILEDGKGTYILNSKDICMIEHIKELAQAGVTSLKVEGRMKTNYYVATVINAYRRAIDEYYKNLKPSFNYLEEVKKTSNRDFTTGFYFENNSTDEWTATFCKQYDGIFYNYEKIVVINAGTDDGVQANMPVISESGLVGYVISATNSTAKVQTIIDTASNVSANISNVQDSVILKGTLNNTETVRATYIPADSTILQGDQVVTSGLGGIYPKGILIGTVKSVVNTKNEADRYAEIEVATDFSRLETVLVITQN